MLYLIQFYFLIEGRLVDAHTLCKIRKKIGQAQNRRTAGTDFRTDLESGRQVLYGKWI